MSAKFAGAGSFNFRRAARAMMTANCSAGQSGAGAERLILEAAEQARGAPCLYRRLTEATKRIAQASSGKRRGIWPP
ncbi:hypothetical protein [Paenibacillus koleovorans]|uniref:hypothetical protein n=1 Tax=Paenibacillus koleovorans TaxID=121608 RepID=UPI0013E384C5|nr:hypothetical protein [Paenibacillus koleovorans]